VTREFTARVVPLENQRQMAGGIEVIQTQGAALLRELSNAVPSRIAEDGARTRELAGVLARQSAGVFSNELTRVFDRQASLGEGQESVRRSLGALAARIEVLEAGAGEIRRDIAIAEKERSDRLLRTVVELSRPANMDRLAVQIREAEEQVSRLQTNGAARRENSEAASVSPRMRAENGRISERPRSKRLREAEEELRSLRQQWEAQIQPWLRALASLPAAGGQSAQPNAR
jgi:hypothetical protein